MNRRQLLAKTAIGGVVWAAPSVLGGSTTSSNSTVLPVARNLVGNPSFQDAAAYTPAPSWSFQ